MWEWRVLRFTGLSVFLKCPWSTNYTLEQKKLCIIEIEISLEPAAIPAWNFLKVFSLSVQMNMNQCHVSFRKWSRSLHILCDFKYSTATLTKQHNQTAFVLRGSPFTLKQQKNMLFPRLALSVTCTNTSRLSVDDCLQEAGMLEPGILYSSVVAHLNFHRYTVLNLWKHYHVPSTVCSCLRSHHQRVTSKGYSAYARLTHVCNCFKTTYSISGSILGLCAISAKNWSKPTAWAHHFPLPTLCVGLHPILQENYHKHS